MYSVDQSSVGLGLWRLLRCLALGSLRYPYLRQGNYLIRLALALGLVGVENAAPLRGGDADDEVELVLIGQLAPQALEVAVVLRRHGEARAVVDAVMVEEHAKNFVPVRAARGPGFALIPRCSNGHSQPDFADPVPPVGVRLPALRVAAPDCGLRAGSSQIYDRVRPDGSITHPSGLSNLGVWPLWHHFSTHGG